jgi:hypothetical protein
MALCSESTGSNDAQHHVAGGDEGLLIGQRNRVAGFGRRQGGRQAGNAGDGRHGPLSAQPGRAQHGLLAAFHPHAAAGQGRRELAMHGGIGADRELGPERPGLLREQRRIAVADQGHHAEASGIGHQKINRAAAHAAGAAQHGDGFHGRGLYCQASIP